MRSRCLVPSLSRAEARSVITSYSRHYTKLYDSIIAEGKIHMAWLAIVGSFSVNGVAALHTELLKGVELKDWYELFPAKFNNKTNGVTQRRWLASYNFV